MLACEWQGRGRLALVEKPLPSALAANEVLIRVKCTGICGTDLHEVAAGPIFIRPDIERVVLGHEFCGDIVDMGAAVTGVSVGERVTAVPHRVCKTCEYCRALMFQHCEEIDFLGFTFDGAFASHVRVREDQVIRIPEGVPDEWGALIEPLAVGLRAVTLPGVRRGADALIVGAGPIGLGVLMMAKACGLGRVIVLEPAEGRRDIATRMGADVVLDGGRDPLAAVREACSGRGVEVAYECVGKAETVNLAIAATGQGGSTIVLGIFEGLGQVDLAQVVRKRTSLRGCIGYFGGEFEGVIELIRTQRLDLDPMITARTGLERIIEEGFERLMTSRDSAGKVVVYPET